MSSKEYVCRYCGARVTKYSTICGECSRKLRLIRQLKQLGEEIRKRERQTNLDRIKNMTADELSVFLWKLTTCQRGFECEKCLFKSLHNCGDAKRIKLWLETRSGSE
jgi:ribosomal protein L40E